MGKKARKNVRKIVARNNLQGISPELDTRIRAIVQAAILPIDQRLDQLSSLILNVKSNVIVSNSILEKKGILEKEEFAKAFEDFESSQIGFVDDGGEMIGSPIFSLYDVDAF